MNRCSRPSTYLSLSTGTRPTSLGKNSTERTSIQTNVLTKHIGCPSSHSSKSQALELSDLERSEPPSLTWKTLPRRCSHPSHTMNAVTTKSADGPATSSAPTGPTATNPNQTLNRKR